MSTISENLISLSSAKDNIATAISGKGVTVPSGSGLLDFANLINSISTNKVIIDELEVTNTSTMYIESGYIIITDSIMVVFIARARSLSSSAVTMYVSPKTINILNEVNNFNYSCGLLYTSQYNYNGNAIYYPSDNFNEYNTLTNINNNRIQFDYIPTSYVCCMKAYSIVPNNFNFVSNYYNYKSIYGIPNSLNVYRNIGRCNVNDNGDIVAYYGDSNYIEDGSNGQVMVKIPKFYYKVAPLYQSNGSWTNTPNINYVISDINYFGFKLHPAFINENGDEIDYFLIGAFEATCYTGSTYTSTYNSSYKLSSVKGNGELRPTVNVNRNQFSSIAKNRGSKWSIMNNRQLRAIQMLFGCEYGFNSKYIIGYGISDGTLHYVGSTTGNDTVGSKESNSVAINWRGIENLWGNTATLINGINYLMRATPSSGQTLTMVECIDYNYTTELPSSSSSNYITITNGDSYTTTGSVTYDVFWKDSANDWIFGIDRDYASNTNSSTRILSDACYGEYVSSSSSRYYKYASVAYGYTKPATTGDKYEAGLFALWGLANDTNSFVGSRLSYMP